MGLISFLRNLASQLGEFLGNNQAGNGDNSEIGEREDYLKFILELLQAEEESNSDVAVIYPMLAQRQHLLNARFAEILPQVAESLIADKNPKRINSILGNIENLSIDIQNFPLGQRANNIEIAITGYQIVLSHREPRSEEWAQTQNNLATAYFDRIRGDRAENLESAIEFYTNALTVYTREAFPQDWAMTQNNLANAYSDRIRGDRADNLENAIEFYTNALTVYTPEAFPQEWALTQENLAYAYIDLKNNIAAIEHFKSALEVLTPGTFPLSCLKAGENLGNLAFELQDWENAIYGYENAISAVEQSREWATSQRRKREILENALNIYEKMVQSCINAQRYETALLTIERSKSRTLIELLDNANLYPQNATDNQKQRLDQLRRQIFRVQQELDSNESPTETETDTNSKTQGRNISPTASSPSPISNLETQLKTLQQQLSELVTEINDPTFTDTQKVIPQLPDFTQLLDPQTALIQWYLPPNPKPPLSTVPIIWMLLQEYNCMAGILFLRPKSGFYTFIVTTSAEDPPKSPLTRGTLKNPVPPLLRGVRGDQTQIEPAEDPPKSPLTRGTLKDPVPPLLRGVRGDQTQIQPLYFPPENRQQLDTDIATYLSDYRQKTWGDTLSSRLITLATSLHLNEILDKIPETIEKLILIPHCDLHLLPLHALKGKRQKADNTEKTGYLIDLFTNGIQYAPSCQILQRLHQRQRQSPPKTPLFAIQNPTEDLRYTEIEVETISRKFNPDTHILRNEQATKNAFNSPKNLAQLSTAYYAHFSCHGSFNPQNPLNSALILAREIATPNLPENRETTEDQHRYITIRDGRRFDTITQGLTLKEIFANLKLPICRLVTLSACETGLVNRLSTDEYIGLPSGFLYAGAINVVSSLWSVGDFSTAFLMVRFYQELDKISNVTIALQAAQKWLKSVSRQDFLIWLENEVKMDRDQVTNLKNFIRYSFPNPEPFAEPQYWAAFCAIGL
ncbi:CHAT domain-containing protein [Aerosakkonemataceae cyanobacterium BLCC-F154]|uniref:CHAT domain-containing protein n=1 Tax=Floridaenema fluviatile BLCC-F154 TaxID=3153640 RepID=A0ABV4YBM8_9CYAN